MNISQLHVTIDPMRGPLDQSLTFACAEGYEPESDVLRNEKRRTVLRKCVKGTKEQGRLNEAPPVCRGTAELVGDAPHALCFNC